MEHLPFIDDVPFNLHFGEIGPCHMAPPEDDELQEAFLSLKSSINDSSWDIDGRCLRKSMQRWAMIWIDGRWDLNLELVDFGPFRRQCDKYGMKRMVIVAFKCC